CHRTPKAASGRVTRPSVAARIANGSWPAYDRPSARSATAAERSPRARNAVAIVWPAELPVGRAEAEADQLLDAPLHRRRDLEADANGIVRNAYDVAGQRDTRRQLQHGGRADRRGEVGHQTGAAGGNVLHAHAQGRIAQMQPGIDVGGAPADMRAPL